MSTTWQIKRNTRTENRRLSCVIVVVVTITKQNTVNSLTRCVITAVRKDIKILKSVCKCTKQKGKATMVKPRKPHDSSTVHRVETQDSGEETYQLFTVKENANSPAFCANLRNNGKDLVMEIDTGSSVSIISKGTFDKRFADNILLTPSTSKLRTYTGEVMPVVGMVEVDVEYKGQK